MKKYSLFFIFLYCFIYPRDCLKNNEVLDRSTEYSYLDNYYFRAGLGNRRMSVGFGIDWSFLKENDARLDYAFVFENPAGAAHVFTYAFSF